MSRDADPKNDELDDDFDEEALDEDELEDARRRRRRSEPRSSASARRRAGRGKRPPRRTEAEINSPKRQTLYLLGSVAAMTLILWGAGRFACNAHPPDSKRPRVATAEQIARTPKGAAIELQQRWSGRDYAVALELARGDAEKALKDDLKSCEADLEKCDRERQDLAGKLLTTGVLLSQSNAQAQVRVTTTGGPAGPESYLLDLRSEGPLWKVVKRTGVAK